MGGKLITGIGVVIVVVVIAVAGFAISRNSGDSDMASEKGDSMMRSEVQKDGKFTGTFLELMALGKNYTCTFTSSDDAGNTTNGTVYIASGGDKLNGEFSLTQTDGSQLDGNIISDGEYNYVWTSLEPQGYKIKVDPSDKTLFSSSEDSEKAGVGIEDSDQVDFDCKSWSVDDSKFTPPSDIEFLDLGQTMQQLQENIGEYENAVDCSICDQLPAGEAQTQCLTTLNCQ